MSFTYPLGLLGLIAIPIILLIYVLQSKYTEQTVPSTYLWQLSEKFLKKRNPLSGITGIISLILQILTVIAVSLAIARPVFTLPKAAYDYCFVLDASGSMNLTEDKDTRFATAQKEIAEVIKDSKSGSSYTLITVANETVTVFEGVKSKDTALELLSSTRAEHTALSHEKLLGTAQKAFDKNSAARIYVITDKSYETVQNTELISVGDPQTPNHAVFDATYSHAGGRLLVEAETISYPQDATLELRLLIDGSEAARTTVNAIAGTRTPVSFEATCTAFDSFTVELVTADGYALDNAVTTYNLKSDKTYSTLIVSDTGFFLKAVIDALVDSRIDVITPAQYETVTEQYGLYVFDSYEPSTLPDGAVWLINADESIPDTGFGIRGKIGLDTADVIEKSKSTATGVRKLLAGVEGNDIYVTNSVKYSGMYLNFHTLFSYDSNPLIFAGENGRGYRQVVFGFDLHESDFALSSDFVMLMRNLLEYSFPNVIEQTNYTVGDEALINVVANADNFKIVSPSGKDVYVDTEAGEAVLMLDEIGTYTIELTLAGTPTSYRIFVGADPEESKPAEQHTELLLAGEATDGAIDGTFDPILVTLILLAILFFADWGVYCYEKYQLR